MFGKLVDSWKARNAIRKIERHPVLGPVLEYLRQVSNDKTREIGANWTEENKQELVNECLTEVEQTICQPNPVQSIRLETIDWLLMVAQVEVLIIQPPTRHKYLSGELKPKISELAEKDKLLKEYFGGVTPRPVGFDDQWDAVVNRYSAATAYAGAYNIARVALKDFHEDTTKDWFRACHLSLCIWYENVYRGKLGLPTLIEGEERTLDLKGIAFSQWVELARAGVLDLRLTWEKAWEKAFDEPSPFTGVAL